MLDELMVAVRAANAATAFAAFFWLLMKLNKHWPMYAQATRAYSMALLLYAFAALYGTTEILATDPAALGVRPVFVLLANASLLWALWQMRGSYTRG